MEHSMRIESSEPVNNNLDVLFETYGDMIYRLALVRTKSIADAEDALEFIMAGASAVAVGAMNFHDPCTTVKVIDGITDYMKEYGVSDIKELIGCVR